MITDRAQDLRPWCRKDFTRDSIVLTFVMANMVKAPNELTARRRLSEAC